jgi:hypothetical protein
MRARAAPCSRRVYFRAYLGVMKHPTDLNGRQQQAKGLRPSCFMAYTLNNHQPVVCTLVSDQPFFYMEDENGIGYDDDDLEGADFGEIEQELIELRRKIETYDRLVQSLDNDPDRIAQEFAADAITIGEVRAQPESASADSDLKTLIQRIAQSRMGKALLDCASAHNVEMVESPHVATARYDRAAQKIFIHGSLGETEQLFYALRELRRHWHHRQGVMLNPLTFYPDQAIVIARAQNADLMVSVVRIAWELQLSGDRALWAYLERGPMADLARSFAREAFSDFRSLANGGASAAAFETWFLSERCRHQDKKVIQAMLADHQGYVFGSEEISRSISIEIITGLGAQPFGKNYLAPYAQLLINDPVFTEVRDRSNANFLWFIKFERSFRETEQALQSADDLNRSGVLPDRSSKPATPEPSAHGQTSIVIQYPRPHFIPKNRTSFGSGTLEGSEPSANVIHVRFGSREGA